MASKKACILYTAAKKVDAQAVGQKLSSEGYDTCLTEISKETALTISAGGNMPLEVQDCLSQAEVCVLLIEEQDAGAFGGIGGLASDQGCRVVSVGGSPELLPPELDDVIDGHVSSPDSPDFADIVGGRRDRIKPDNTSAPKRDEDRVKCQ